MAAPEEIGLHDLLGAVQERNYGRVTELLTKGISPCSLLVTNAQGEHALNVLLQTKANSASHVQALEAVLKECPKALLVLRNSANCSPLDLATRGKLPAKIFAPYTDFVAPEITAEDRKAVEERDWPVLATLLTSFPDDAEAAKFALFTNEQGANSTVLACTAAAREKPLSPELKSCCLRLLAVTPPSLLLLRTYYDDPIIHSVISSGDLDLVEAALKVLPMDAFDQHDMCKASPLSTAFFSQNREVTLRLIDAMDTEDLIIAGYQGEPPLKAAVQHSRDPVVVAKLLDRLEGSLDSGEVAEALTLLVDLYIGSGETEELRDLFSRVMEMVRRDWYLDGWTKRGIRSAARSALRQRCEALIAIINESAPLNELFVIPGLETIFHEAARDWAAPFFEYLFRHFPTELLMVDAKKPTVRRGELAADIDFSPFLPIHLALLREDNDVALLKLIIDNMTDEGLEFLDGKGDTILHHAARNGAVDVVAELLARVPHLKTATNKRSQTPLDVAKGGNVQQLLAPMAKRA